MVPEAVADKLGMNGACVAWTDCRAMTTSPDRKALHAIRLVFDRGFYLSSYADVAASGIDPLDHFLTCGLKEGRTPCSLFDPDHYLLQPGAPASRDSLFLHYLTVGVTRGLDPHPLINSAFYISQMPRLPQATDPLVHMLGTGRRENRKPNPLFDPAFYRRRQLQADRSLHPLIHYALQGWRDRLQPHPLFDPNAYFTARPDVAAVGADALAHYLHHGRYEEMHFQLLFEPEHYISLCDDVITPLQALLHFAQYGTGPKRSPHPLFDVAYYLHHQPDLAEAEIDPFLHFVEFGIHENRDPHPLFDSWFYRTHNPDIAVTGIPPFLHYLRYGIAEARDPNPFFPAAIYNLHHPAAKAELAGPLAHFLRNPDTHMQQISDEFDPVYYRACHPSYEAAARFTTPPLMHYLSIGRANRLSPVARPLQQYDWILPPRAPATRRGAAGTVPLLLVVQEATHGDRALCALRALEILVTDPGLHCRVVIRHDGPLARAFADLAPTMILPAEPPGTGPDRLADILYSLRERSSDSVVLINSAAMTDLVASAARLRLRLLAWLHELPLSIDSLLGGDRTMQALALASTRIVTNSEAARATLIQHYRLPAEQVVSIPDGVARSSMSDDAVDPRQVRMALREGLGLPPDALIVLGSGSISFGSGTDLFIQVANDVISGGQRHAAIDSALRQAFFLWVGSDDDPLFASLCQHDIERLGLSNRVRLLPVDAQEPRTMLMVADLFLLTAREPIGSLAALEAATGGIPVIGFAGDASAECTVPGERFDVPYLDLDAMSAMVVTCGDRPARRMRATLRPAINRPSWADWHSRFRMLLLSAYGYPLSSDQPSVDTTSCIAPALRSRRKSTQRQHEVVHEPASLG